VNNKFSPGGKKRYILEGRPMTQAHSTRPGTFGSMA